ncbi:two-component sensor histidine kinase [Erwinia sp. OLTSP20]|uniref:sensor histidine kinase n=1 Tax=unclassified Erwinia TaxID=2622719 RepID=UPI000C1868B3|nr:MULTISPECIES: ATP-binding protein [unclassified Erwinia]PIJ49952.1 two-component sensor histidine kinase [Erwinia sp. OAMSP11]PIJ71400.1 two-component sensor histidine kinase [Erwinia sp. OLSSP12]PIJ80634.1 two-component sensor histidine kinase [Erwinia sp. OLCASP19]PIJ82769.1 two-component sensor histidine kinase [Erwinia sp. OLMTSP26]PIJ85455.1 two-component sensor histidine kinase [Erwinia sp. OLMDSP33]
MVKIISWLLLSLLSSGGLVAYFLQQQYEEKSADFRILYRDVTIKLAQHDAIIRLLPANPLAWEVQKLFPHIIRLRQHSTIEPWRALVVGRKGQYWLNIDNQSLLIDLNRLVSDIRGKKRFSHLIIQWNNVPLFEQGAASPRDYWRWQKAISSRSQPFMLIADDRPDWMGLPWTAILAPALFWGLLVYLFSQYRSNKRRRDIADMRSQYAELTRLNTMGELAAGIIHELNQPLTAILSYNQTAQRMMRQQHPGQVSALLEAAVVQIKRIDALLQQFRQKLIGQQADYQPIVLGRLWAQVVTLLDKEISSKKIRVSSRIPDNLPLLYAPPLWIEQILHNIAHNAVQAQEGNKPGTSWINLTAKAANAGILLRVTDGGPGLSEQALQQVFMPFFTTRSNGIGLGMALTETLIQRLNGNIQVSNMTGQGGASFTIWLPVHLREE